MKVTACLVGSLVGDGWMKLPGLCDLSQEHDLTVVAGSYALPVWQWGKTHLQNAHYRIDEVMADPDDPACQWCPGFGHIAMDRALEYVKQCRPEETVIGGDEIPTCYYRDTPTLQLHKAFESGDWATIHPWTRHSWKNCRGVLMRATYPLPVKVLGLPGEIDELPEGWQDLSGEPFDDQVAAVAGCRFFVGIGSSWSNAATLFHKHQIHVSYTDDLAQFTNPRMVKLVEPSLPQLQEEIDALCAASISE